MKAYKCILGAAIAALSLASCQDDNNALSGEGRVVIEPSISTDVKVASRADGDALRAELGESLILWISNSKGVVRQYQGIDNVPAEISLISGQYLAEAWAGDSVSASWDKRWFKASVPFEVSAGATTAVDVKCKIANVVVSVEYAPDVADVLKDYTLEVGHSRGHLVFDEEHLADKAYFMMPSTDTDLAWTLTGTKKADGATVYTRTSTIANVKPGYEYKFKVSCASQDEELHGAFLDIVVDETEVLEEENVLISVAPVIKIYQFDIDEVQHLMPGKIGKISTYIAASEELASVKVTCAQLASVFGADDAIDFEVFGLTSAVQQILADGGITWSLPNGDKSLLKLVFEEEFTNLAFIEDGKDYAIEIEAIDINGMKTVKTISIAVSGEPFVPDPVVVDKIDASDAAAISHTSAVLTATIAHPESIGDNMQATFYYAQGAGLSRAQWIEAPATIEGKTCKAEITGLTPGADYTYYLSVTGDLLDEPFVSETMSFTTEAALQLPNAGFEGWSKPGKVYLVHGDGEQMFWDSGNHGSSTMNKNITNPDESLKHSGNYSAKLSSQFVGLGSIGKFAAGNVFIGKYLGTDGTDGVLGFGRPFTGRPTALNVWVKYIPGTVQYTSDGAPDIVKGQPDKGIIYVALLDDHTETYEGENFPVIVKTKAANRQLFDKNSEHVIAYGELVFDKATEGDGLVQYAINLDYKRTGVRPSYILLVGSASKGGDYFSGGDSTMWLDDFELAY